MPTPELPLLQFQTQFAKSLQGAAVSGVNAEIAAKLSQIECTPFTPNEIQIAAR